MPVASEPVAGAFGALWKSDLWVVVDTSAPAFYGPLGTRDCPPAQCGPPPPPPPAGDAVKPAIYRTRAGETPGILLYIDRQASRDVSFSLRAYDESRRNATEGVAIPVVRERHLVAGRTIHLLDISARTGTRVKLRIYDIDRTAGGTAAVRVYRANGSDELLFERIVMLHAPPHDDRFRWPYPLQPSAVELDLDPVQLGAGENDVLRIEVRPASAQLRLWAFASITNNSTNEVTLAIPD